MPVLSPLHTMIQRTFICASEPIFKKFFSAQPIVCKISENIHIIDDKSDRYKMVSALSAVNSLKSTGVSHV